MSATLRMINDTMLAFKDGLSKNNNVLDDSLDATLASVWCKLRFLV